MLQVFRLNVSKVDVVLQLVFYMHVSCVLSAFRRMSQVLHPDVLKVDQSVASLSWLLCCLIFASVFPPPPLSAS
jgi:hypothetical protein